MKLQTINPALAFLFPADVRKVLIHIKSYSGSVNHYNIVRDALGKKKHQRITIKEFAEYEGLPLEEIVTCLYG